MARRRPSGAGAARRPTRGSAAQAPAAPADAPPLARASVADAGAAGSEGVVMAQIGAPHGVRGSVRLTVFAEDPLTLRRYNPFTTPDGNTLTLKGLKRTGKAVVCDIEGVGDRDAAAALRGTLLSVPRERLPAPEADEFYHVDLVGLEARLADRTVVGHVRGVADFGAGDVLELTGNVMVPFTRKVVPEVDVAGGFLVIDPPAGLLDDPDAQGEGGQDGAPPDERQNGREDDAP